MKTSEFDYQLPQELIAAVPPAKRDSSRMLVLYRKSGKLEHRTITDLPEYLESGDVLVLNDTKVIPARLLGYKESTGGQVELLLLYPYDKSTSWEWGVECEALYRSSRPLRPNMKLILADGVITATVVSKRCNGRVVVKLLPASNQEKTSSLLQALNEKGKMPVPPYVLRAREQYKNEQKCHNMFSEIDKERYQTIYASTPGAIAAPTAGLHFTEELFNKLNAKNVLHTFVTLHVGVGTFQEVDVENIEEHHMEAERYSVKNESAMTINSALSVNKRVVAVGTTTVRVLESVMLKYGQMRECSGWTSLFIYPGFRFKVNALLTNFHLPRSTLIMLVCAFVSEGVGDVAAGREIVLNAYNEAINERYRFYSYGDCMLII